MRPRRQKHVVEERDEHGRPTSVLFDGNPALQCPACLSREVESWGAVGFLPTGDRILDANMSPIRQMRCRDCGARWTRAGLWTTFDPSPARRGLDLLLTTHPHLDLVAAWVPGHDRREETDPGRDIPLADPDHAETLPGLAIPWASSPWLRVDLGQPSEGESEAYARWSFAIWRSTGAVHRMSDGAVDDDPFIVPSPVESYNAAVRDELATARALLAECRDEWVAGKVAYPTHHWLARVDSALGEGVT